MAKTYTPKETVRVIVNGRQIEYKAGIPIPIEVAKAHKVDKAKPYTGPAPKKKSGSK